MTAVRLRRLPRRRWLRWFRWPWTVPALLTVSVLGGVLVWVLVAPTPRMPPAGPPARVAGAGLVGRVGPVPRACAGVEVRPGQDVQGLIDTHPPGTTFCLSAGTYRTRTPWVPRRGDSFIGRPGAVLSGSTVLSGWRRDAVGWSAPGDLASRGPTGGECLPSVPTCAYAEDVFLDKRRLRRVGSRSAVIAGTVYADYGGNTVTIGDDPTSHLVEQAVAPGLIRATVDDVTVADLVLEQAANPAQLGAVENRRLTPLRTGSGWRIQNNEVRLNHGVGLGFGTRTLVAGNHVHDQGQLGFGAWGSDSTIVNNEISSNGQAGYSPGWEAGGSKLWTTDGVTIVHNWVHDNLGPGLWADGGNLDTRYEDNLVTDNWGAGIQHEISYDAVIRRNEISGNGRVHKGWAWEAGIQIQSSGGIALIEIADNVLSANANGIALIDSGDRVAELPAPHGPHVVRNVWVHDNSVTMGAGQLTGAVEDRRDPSVFTGRNNRFDHNTYRLDSLVTPHFSWDGRNVSWLRWRHRGDGNDRHGRALLIGRTG